MYRPNAVRSVLTTSVKILPYRLPAPAQLMRLTTVTFYELFAHAVSFIVLVLTRGGGEHSATPGTFFVFGSSNKK